ncbi:DUF4387 domain-containing protein [Pigmentiphaga soli]|uniref:DUF4387 domain-containing protein n=1 Tax=Pigmentiphaga soli TaxID=1007095 RepID=A0ABP8HQQ0_9BURK
MKLKEISQIVRSKNAGPRTLTLDIMFADDGHYELARRSGAINAAAIGALYDTPAEQVRVIEYPLCRAIKIALPRKITAGDPGDADVYGAQQHARLFEVEL